MSDRDIPFDRLVELVRSLSKEDQRRLLEAAGLDISRPGEEQRPAPETGAEYHCGDCGTMMPPDDLPPRCPSCGAPRERFVLEAED